MRAKLMRLVMSGMLVLPVCLTGVVTAFQFQGSRAAIEDEKSVLSASVSPTIDEAAPDESIPATPIVPAAKGAPNDSSEPAPSKDVEPGRVAAPPAPGPDATPDSAKQLLRKQRANREYFARLTVDGLLPGRFQYVDGLSRGLVPAKRVTINFVQHGKVVSQAKPGVDGFFQAAGLVPGFYTVVASGLDGIATFGIEIHPALKLSDNAVPDGRVKENVRMKIESEQFRLQQAESESMRDAESFLRIDAVLVPPRDIPVARRIMEVYLTPRPGKVVPPTMSRNTVRPGAQRNTQLVSAQPLQKPVPGSPGNPIRGSWGTPLRLPVFYAHSNGAIGGRLTYFVPDVTNRDVHFRAPVPGGLVYFIRNGVVVEQASTDRDGRFEIFGLPVGDYTFVSAGSAGVTAFGTTVMPHAPDAVDRKPGVKVKSVSSIRLVQAPGEGQGQTGMSDQDVDVDTSNPNDVSSADMFGQGPGGADGAGGGGAGAGGGGAGGGGGGAGGGGAGGGLGGLLLGGAIAGGIAGGIAASQNDNNGTSTTPIASPSTP